MVDRRSDRTKGYLRKAMLELLQARPLGQISVKELAEQAQVSKNSFYNHYESLEDLAQDCYAHQLVYFGTLRKRRGDYSTRREAVSELLEQRVNSLEFLRANPNLARAILIHAGVSPYYARAEELEEELTVDHLVYEYGPQGDDVPCYLSYRDCAHFISAGWYAVMRRWFFEGMVEDPVSVAKRGVHLSLQVAAGMAGRPIEPEYAQAIEEWRLPQGAS